MTYRYTLSLQWCIFCRPTSWRIAPEKLCQYSAFTESANQFVSILFANKNRLKAFKDFPVIWPFAVYLTNFQWERLRPWLPKRGSLQRQYWQKVTGHANPCHPCSPNIPWCIGWCNQRSLLPWCSSLYGLNFFIKSTIFDSRLTAETMKHMLGHDMKMLTRIVKLMAWVKILLEIIPRTCFIVQKFKSSPHIWSVCLVITS